MSQIKQVIPEVDYADFAVNLSRYPRRPAEEGAFELTYRCNLNCLHCYCNDPLLQRQKEELSYQEWCALIDRAAEEGCLWGSFTGGEPLLRDDFLDIYLYAKKKGFILSLLTNATLFDKEAMKILRQWPPKQVEVSLYGVTASTHEKVTAAPGSFAKTMRGLDLLRQNNIPLEIKHVALTVNCHESKAVKDYAQSLGAGFRYDTLVHCRLNGDKAPHQLRLSAEKGADIDMELKDMQDFWQKECSHFSGVEVDCQKLYTCGAGRAMFWVNPYGNLQTCSFPGKITYNLREGSFHHWWHTQVPQIIQRCRQKEDFYCRGCPVRALCSQCPNWAYLENKDEEKEVDYICAFFKERARRFGMEYILKKEEKDASKKSLQKTADRAH